jgi:hypothetical protein
MSMLEIAQAAANAGGIERIFALVGNAAAVDPAIVDSVDFDYGIGKMSYLLNQDPQLIRSPAELQNIRQRREQQQAQAQRAEQAEKLAKGAQVLSQTDIGGGQQALAQMLGRQP